MGELEFQRKLNMSDSMTSGAGDADSLAIGLRERAEGESADDSEPSDQDPDSGSDGEDEEQEEVKGRCYRRDCTITFANEKKNLKIILTKENQHLTQLKSPSKYALVHRKKNIGIHFYNKGIKEHVLIYLSSNLCREQKFQRLLTKQ